MSALTKQQPLDVGRIPEPGECIQARLSIDAHAVYRLIADEKISANIALLEEAEQALKDTIVLVRDRQRAELRKVGKID